MSPEVLLNYTKKEATEEDVKLMCEHIANARCIKDIPQIRNDVYFSPQQARKICYTHNEFVHKMNRLADALKRDKFNSLIKSL